MSVAKYCWGYKSHASVGGMILFAIDRVWRTSRSESRTSVLMSCSRSTSSEVRQSVFFDQRVWSLAVSGAISSSRCS